MTDFGVQLPDFFNAAQQINGGQFWKDAGKINKHQPQFDAATELQEVQEDI